ncbi:MAG: isochorismatase family protein [Leptothrix sp. (in: b-proteobacteria)]
MTRMTPDASALVLIDYQGRLMPAIDRAEAVLAQAVFLADIAHELGVPVLGTEQNPRGLGPNDAAVRSRCDRTLSKMHFNACADGLVEALNAARPGLQSVVIAGCEAHVCLLQTALGLLETGLKVWVVGEACGSRRATDHALGLARLQQAGAVIVSAEMVVFEWLGSCEHPRFKPVLQRLKAHDQPVRA